MIIKRNRTAIRTWAQQSPRRWGWQSNQRSYLCRREVLNNFSMDSQIFGRGGWPYPRPLLNTSQHLATMGVDKATFFCQLAESIFTLHLLVFLCQHPCSKFNFSFFCQLFENAPNGRFSPSKKLTSLLKSEPIPRPSRGVDQHWHLLRCFLCQ